ncbi:MAG TPA: condensation domain-containing protein, partial [Candidatus Deferrimicrobium sp.]|nr:condensation domain-containing protein [Candidatus Deferrimicrobium sp.]
SGRWTQGFNHHLKHIITAGEQLKITAGLKRFLDLNPGLRLHNHYGSTEMHVVTSYSLDAATAGRTPIPPVGKPIDNVKIYILDEYYHPVPIGVYGELFVSGSSEVLGYINNEELNREKLFYHPELSEANKRLYRSGDIGRWSADGNIELRGRKDFQVKIRGFRIEPGEIESKIMAIENIRECVVVVKEDGAHQKYLAAYVSVDNIEISDIKKKIGHDLPQYMIPQLVVLDSLPLMPNGKVDRDRLPEPQVEMEATYTGPRDEVESTLAGIWAEILNLPGPSVGIDANFFELGGHSLKATLVMSHIHKRLHKKIPLAEIFKAPTIRELAVYVKGVPVEGYTAIPPALSKDFYVLSPAQKRLFILQQMEKGTINYNLPVIVLLEGKLEEKKLSGIFKRMIARHESFRTSFEVVAGEAVQRIHENVAFEIEYNEYNDSSTGYRDEKNNRLHHSSFIIHHFIRAFDLSKAPLLRIGLLKQEENKHLLLVDMHHIITDGTSLGIFTREFMALYTGEELPPLRLRYRDYSEWVTGEGQQEIMRRQEEYWLKQFEGDIPVLDLPADYARPTVQSFEGRTMVFEITPFETAQLKKYAHERNSTLYVMLLAAFGILIAKLSGQEDIIIGTPTAGRRHADLESIIGMFVNTLALRNFPAGEISFDEYLGDVTRRTWEAFENQDYPFEDLVEKVVQNRNTGRNPLFDVMFVLQNLEVSEILIPGLKLSPYRYEIGTAKFDIMLSGVEEGDRLNFGCEYCSKLFKENTIRRFTDFFKKIISIVMGNPCIRLSEIEIISAEEKKQVLINFNDTIHRYPQDKTIHQLFEEQVEITPDHIAVFSHGRTPSPTNTDNNMSITYRQLNEQSGRLAGLLIEKGVLPDNVVGLMIDRSIEMMVGLLGILKSGGAYLPIAPEYPKERIDYMLKDSHAKVLIINKSEIRNPKLETNSNKTNSNEPNKNFEDMMVLDFKHLNLISQKECPRRGLHHPNHLAYIIYTSGSTGKPKGVMVQKEGFLNLLRWYIKELDITEADNHLLIAPISFDLAQKNLFSPFLVGGRLTLAAPGIPDYRELAGTIHKEHITMINCAPSVFYPLIEMNHDGSFTRLQSLRVIILGGEPIRFDRLLPWVNSDGFHCEILNTYGPTECTDIATCYRIPGKSVYSPGTIPIGRPIYNVRVYVLDKYLQ